MIRKIAFAAYLAGAVLSFGDGARAQTETNAVGVFHGIGIVKAIQARTGALTLDHEDIAGWMPAMEMMYKVKSPAVSKGVKIGDRVGFDVDAKSYTILRVEPAPKAK